MWGKLLNRWIALLSLATIVAISLACSSGDDFVQGSQISRNDTFGNDLPPDIPDSLEVVDGSTLIVSDSYDDNFIESDGSTGTIQFDVFLSLTRYEDYDDAADLDPVLDAEQIIYGNEESDDSENESILISDFTMMETEVTVQMFADFLNAIAANSDELTSAGEGETSGFTDVASIYKPVMQEAATCGIFRFEFGERTNDEISQTSYFMQNKPSDDGYIDPYLNIQKPRMASEDQSNTFEVAPGRKNYPMVFVTQEDAKEFCRWLGPQYRLPTWQEWGYAGRGGQTYQFPTSNGELFNNGERLANIQYPNDQAGSTTEVKTYAPNPYGLYDMAGNVYEWTYFREESQATSTVPYSGGKFIMGGSFKTQNPAYATTWNRFGLISQDSWTNDIGFRVVFDVNSGTSAAESEINIDGL